MLVQQSQLSKAVSCLYNPDDLAKTGIQVLALHQAALPEPALTCVGLSHVCVIVISSIGCFHICSISMQVAKSLQWSDALT
jgi:hypothetical protein